jgi:hypothetical protein
MGTNRVPYPHTLRPQFVTLHGINHIATQAILSLRHTVRAGQAGSLSSMSSNSFHRANGSSVAY